VPENNDRASGPGGLDLADKVAEEGLVVDGEERLGPSHPGGFASGEDNRDDVCGHVR